MREYSIKEICGTCHFWQVLPQDPQSGVCPLLGAVLWPTDDWPDDPQALSISIHYGNKWFPKALTAVLSVRTQLDFGCINYEPNPEGSSPDEVTQ